MNTRMRIDGLPVRERWLFDRVKAEYLEMPGLCLTPAQAARLWAVDHKTSERILERLTAARFLYRNAGGNYVRS